MGPVRSALAASGASVFAPDMLGYGKEPAPSDAYSIAEAPPSTTVLVGGKTLVAPRATARLLARALHANSIDVPGAAHMIPLTHPAAVVDAISREVPS